MEKCNQYQKIKNRAEIPAEKLRLNIVLKNHSNIYQ